MMLSATAADTASGTGSVIKRRVSFRTPDGVTLVGHLRTPAGPASPRPAVIVINAMTGVKEQSVQAGYAQGLAARGFTTLVFDQRGFGESGNGDLPRQHEDNEQRMTDLHVAVSYLAKLHRHVDPDRITSFGVSIGGGLALKLAAADARIKAFGAVAAGLLDPVRAKELWDRTPGGFDAALQAQTEALAKFHETGRYDYLPVVRGNQYPESQPVLFEGPIAQAYYGTSRGMVPQWRNKASTLSVRTLLVHDTRNAAAVIGSKAGFLAVGTEDVSTFPEDHQAVYDLLTGPRKLLMVDGAEHNDLYDVPRYTGRVLEEVAAWFRQHAP